MADPLPLLEVPRLSPTDRLVGLPPLLLRLSRDGARPLLATAVRVATRAGRLLVRFDGRDRGVTATLTRRDDPLWKEDVFEVFLSPDDRPAVYYEFEVNPLGTLFDARVESPEGRRETMRVDASWNCPGLSARVRRRPERWSALFSIPLEPLSPGPAAVWRANFHRIDRGNPDEYSAWSPTGADPPDFHRPERFGYLRMP
ncbi:MAG: carbohydrate-binding family 9-like protein [Thermoanaerobaculia bacterium]